MSLTTAGMAAAVVAFAIVSGANDGSALLAASLNMPTVRPIFGIALLTGTLIAGPYLVGTQVAATLATKLVAVGNGEEDIFLIGALMGAVGVVAVLSRLGIPTSLTLALIGGLTGAGLGFGLPVSWSSVWFVLAMAAIAPVVGALLGNILLRLLKHLPERGSASERLAWLHRGGIALQAVAYSLNDGQKVLAMFAVAMGATASVRPRFGLLALIAVLFTLGMLLGIRRLGGTLISGVMLARPVHVVTAELSAAAAVLGSTAVGAPVSMTQSITAALVGTGMSEGYGRVRWQRTRGIVLAWAFTLPLAAGVAVAFAAVAAAVRG